MIEPRVYRAAFIPALLALAVAMFSLQSAPSGAPLDLAADVLFEGDPAAATAEQIARRHPDRRPGTEENAAVAELVAARLEGSGFEVEVDEFTREGHDLVNVVGTLTGSGRDRIVVMAPRDADSVPDVAGSAVDTATLLELAVALEGRAPEKTIVLASVDGSTLGDAGARRFAEGLPDAEEVQAVLALSDLGAPTPDGPSLVAWSNDSSRGSIGLDRTAGEALRSEFESVPNGDGAGTQFAHLAAPLGVGAQGVLLDRGIESVRFSGSGLLPPSPEPVEIDAGRVGGLGRAVLQTISALDASEGIEHGPPSYLLVGRSALPGWSVSLLALSLILPVLVASIDAYARARRRREPVGRWAIWMLARIAPFVAGLALALLLAVAGLAPDLPAAPAPSIEPLGAGAAALMGVVAGTVALAWIFVRPALARRGGAGGDPGAAGAGCAVALTLSATALAVWLMNPWAALAIVPAAHLWTLSALSGGPVRPAARAALVGTGLVIPAAIALAYMVELSLDPPEALWYVFVLVTGGQVGLLTALAACALLGSLVAVVEVSRARLGRSPTPTGAHSRTARRSGHRRAPGEGRVHRPPARSR